MRLAQLGLQDKSILEENVIFLQVLAEDLKLFVEMFQTFCEDPRDLAEVRVSEAKLKEELKAVQRQLKGHELQVGCTFPSLCESNNIPFHLKGSAGPQVTLPYETFGRDFISPQ